MRSFLLRHLAWLTLAGVLALPSSVAAQPAPTPAPEPEPVVAPANFGTLVVHILGSRGTYLRMRYDVFNVETRQMVASGRGSRETRGEVAESHTLPAGTYKIIRRGEPFDTRVDYAIAKVEVGATTDYLLVIDEDSNAFRGSGPVIGPLPRGTEIAGFKVSLNGGGSLLLNQRYNAVGSTSGTTAVVGLFGNFGVLFEEGNHLVDVNADFRLDLVDPITGSWMATGDRFSASALYSYKMEDSPFGPYIRANMETRLFPGFVYLESDGPSGSATINRLDGTSETRTFGAGATADDLRIRVAEPFAPLKLQEEIGANLQAVDVDLQLLKLTVGTRLGFGLRQGFTNGLLVVRGDEDARPVIFDEVDSYNTAGPVLGGNARVTFARWLFASARVSILVPISRFRDAGETFGDRLLINFAGSAGFKVPILTNLLYASADYTFRLEQDGFITEETQFEHSLMARATITFF